MRRFMSEHIGGIRVAYRRYEAKLISESSYHYAAVRVSAKLSYEIYMLEVGKYRVVVLVFQYSYEIHTILDAHLNGGKPKHIHKLTLFSLFLSSSPLFILV